VALASDRDRHTTVCPSLSTVKPFCLAAGASACAGPSNGETGAGSGRSPRFLPSS